MVLWSKRNSPEEDELPPELKGKSPQEIVDALRKAQDLETQLNTLKTESDKDKQTLTSMTTEFEQQKQRLADLEGQQKPAKQPPVEDDEPSIWTDPQKWVQDQTRDTQNIALMSGIMSARLTIENSLTPRDRKIWNKYQTDVAKIMESYPPQQRVLPQNWMMALTIVKGQHDQDIARDESSSSGIFAEGVSHGAPPPDDTQGEVKLTPEEEETCRVMHWDAKRYLDQKKKQTTRQSEKGAYATFGV